MFRKALLMLIAMVSPIESYSDIPFYEPTPWTGSNNGIIDPYDYTEECLNSKVDIKYRLCDIQNRIDRLDVIKTSEFIWSRARVIQVELWRKEVNSRLDNIEGCLTED